jgi:hypothetical protein
MSIEHNGIKFEKMANDEYRGISKNGLECFIRHRPFKMMAMMTGASTGYVAVPLSYNAKVSENFFRSNQDSCDVHGSITFINDKLPFTKPFSYRIKEESVVLGFDAAHLDSPDHITIEFMIDELLKLDQWVYDIIMEKN